MPRLVPIALSATLLILAGAQLSSAEDAPPPPPAPQAATEAETPKSDPEALKVLAEAAKRQGGAALAEEGALRSFRIEFGRVKVFREDKQPDGRVVRAMEEASALEIDWMRHEGKPSSLKTYWEINGKKVTRAVLGTRNYFWIYDGVQSNPLSEGTHDEDRDEVLLHRRLAETLIDVAVLQKLLQDGSVWTKVEDATYPGIALRRSPPPGSEGLHFTLWLDPETKDPRHVRVDPLEEGAPTLHYELTHHAEGLLPTVEGAELRFPFEVSVKEAATKDAKPERESMHLWIKRVVFNQGKIEDFVPPR